jgi:hypothetical protein
MTENSQLNNSLTSMDWLYGIGTPNKQILQNVSTKNFKMNLQVIFFSIFKILSRIRNK